MLDKSVLPYPLAIDPHGRQGLVLRRLIHGDHIRAPLSFAKAKPNAAEMYRLIASLTSPNSIIVLCRKPAFVGSTIVLGNFTAILTLHPLIVSTIHCVAGSRV